MKRSLILLFIAAIFLSCKETTSESKTGNSVVDKFGSLQVQGTSIKDQNGDTVVLRGMSLFWSQWGGHYYNASTLKWLRDDWGITVIRAAMGIESGGYLQNQAQERDKVESVIDMAIGLGIYVIVDWHDHHAENHEAEAVAFFSNLSEKYGEYDNLIYEIYNEPLNTVSWGWSCEALCRNGYCRYPGK